MSTTCEETRVATDVPDLIPARMLNEFAYCPRLAYLEWVQGEFADNLEVLEGRFSHRRVDRPSRKEVPGPGQEGDGDAPADSPHPNPLPAGEAEPQHNRSVMLSAPGEGLIARIDLLEVQAGIAVPVDYKRGKVPDVSGGAWEPEQVQLCAQGLILRENAYAMLVNDLTVVLQGVGFDPMLGFYHRPRYGRPSLALDLAEPFRPLVADSVVLTAVNNGDPLQYSVFRYELSPTEKQVMKQTLWELLNWDHDRVMLVDLGPAGARGDHCVEFWGEPRLELPSRVAVVV